MLEFVPVIAIWAAAGAVVGFIASRFARHGAGATLSNVVVCALWACLGGWLLGFMGTLTSDAKIGAAINGLAAALVIPVAMRLLDDRM